MDNNYSSVETSRTRAQQSQPSGWQQRARARRSNASEEQVVIIPWVVSCLPKLPHGVMNRAALSGVHAHDRCSRQYLRRLLSPRRSSRARPQHLYVYMLVLVFSCHVPGGGADAYVREYKNDLLHLAPISADNPLKRILLLF